MKKLLFAGLVGLIGLAGCSETKKEREVIDGYVCVQHAAPHHTVRRIFTHNEVNNVDTLTLYNVVAKTRVVYTDWECDEEVDTIESLSYYIRGVIGKDELFVKADEEYKRIKKEMGIE